MAPSCGFVVLRPARPRPVSHGAELRLRGAAAGPATALSHGVELRLRGAAAGPIRFVSHGAELR